MSGLQTRAHCLRSREALAMCMPTRGFLPISLDNQASRSHGRMWAWQATVGTLVGKTLSSSSTNPYQAAQAGQVAGAVAPAALDVFSIQASPAPTCIIVSSLLRSALSHLAAHAHRSSSLKHAHTLLVDSPLVYANWWPDLSLFSLVFFTVYCVLQTWRRQELICDGKSR